MHRAVLAFAALIVAGCTASPPDGGEGPPAYDPGVSAADFVQGIDNPFLPLAPGAVWTYEAETEDGTERIEVRVLNETRTIMGVEATVVRDTVTIEGELVEDTLDWYAQDREGNVWYLGEDTTEYEGGEVVSRAGSWEWGVDGALPGVVMWADPRPDGDPYFQEFYWGQAVDEAAVVDRGRTIATRAGTFDDTVTTREWTRLEPGVEELAHYARGVGVVLKEVSEGEERGQREELVSYQLP